MNLEMERIILRPFQPVDFKQYVKQISRRKPAQHQHDEGYIDLTGFTAEQFKEKLDRFNKWAEDDHIYVFAIIRKEDQALLGHVDMLILQRDDTQWASGGYALHNQFWGEGYGTESLRGLIRMAFEKLNLHRLEAQINLDNTASVKIAEKAGMQYECTRKKFIHENGEWTDHLIYSIYAE
ncbi:GNAT family N-acetyltransferase [Jeotgalibacillus salarius]|uniref:N-acetyltransferase n=1 Tax=Jeotgalibacillus salarius TaxID=546023 RepID=A0A4Y8LLK8_9BACL|nr:GNAT family protein [Jeotgalibacillus salarius]TFE02127.1 N-acetyltransferase [Jeotgalibacillus salarius]